MTYTVYTDSACSQGGQAAGTKTVSNGAVPDSNALTLGVGTYYWQAVYTGDLNNGGSTSTCTDEQLVVNQRQPTLPTTPSPSSGTVGVAVLNDSATLSGAYNSTGSITFNLFDPGQTGCSGTAVFSVTVSLTGSGATTTTGPTANKAGTWNWTASYAGDTNNAAASSLCSAEAVTIAKVSPSIGTTPDPSSGNVGVKLNDSASLTGGYNASGTITFNLYDPDQTCGTDTPRYTQTVTVASDGASTTNTTFATDKSGTWRWTASYSGDGNNNPIASGCADEQVTVNLIPSTINTAQTFYPNDTANVTGTTGNVTFELFGPFTTSALVSCSGSSAFSQTVAQSSGQAKTTNYPTVIASPFGITTGTGWYGWRVTAATDATHEGRRSDCTEKFNLATVTNDAGTGTKFP